MLSLKHDRLFRLIRMLTGNKGYTVAEMTKELGVSQRSIYYYLTYLKDNGFVVFRSGDTYRIDRHSPFIIELARYNQFSDEDLRTIHSVLMMVGDKSQTATELLFKLERTCNFDALNSTPALKRLSNNTAKLAKAIREEQVVRLVNYSSPHSSTVKDRYVEPYLLLNSNQDVRCFELGSNMNKTFKVTRADSIEIMDMHWLHADEHTQMFTDLFMFSGPDHQSVKLRLDRLAYNLFCEEYPLGRKYITPDGDDHWVLELEVCDFRGVGRFVLGLYEHIDVLANNDFIKYVVRAVDNMAGKTNKIKSNISDIG